MGEPIVSAAGLGKRFKIYPSPAARLAEWISLGGVKRHQDFWALRNVSFELARGECLGVIGANGSGKSTLLKILTGSLFQTEGLFEVRGRVLSLLELGTGMNLELSGRDNVVNCSRLLDFPNGYAESKMAQIERFAELGDFFDRPVKLYSSGMNVRLAFSMWTCFEPEVLIVDEALSVGDVFFQQKCFRRARELLDAGTAMLFVSHDLGAVQTLCKKVMVLEHGQCKHLGDAHTGIRIYFANASASSANESADTVSAQNKRATPALPPDDARMEHHDYLPAHKISQEELAALTWVQPDRTDAIGDGRVELLGMAFRCEGAASAASIVQGGWLEIFTRWKAVKDAPLANIGIALTDRSGKVLFARSWINAGIEPADLKAGDEALALFKICMDMEPADYAVMLTAAESYKDPKSPSGWNHFLGGVRYLELPRAAQVSIRPRSDNRVLFFGVACLPNSLHRELSAPRQ